MMEFNDRIVVAPPSNDNFSILEISYIYLGRIKPNRVIKDKNVYEIIYVDPIFIMSGFVVMTENRYIQNILLFGFHPNRDPNTSLYCLPERKKQVDFTEQYFKLLLTNLKTYYLDDCFYTPSLSQLKYKKMKSIYLKLNQGE